MRTHGTYAPGDDDDEHVDYVDDLINDNNDNQDYDLRQEQLNKSSLLSSEKFLDGLLDMWTTQVQMTPITLLMIINVLLLMIVTIMIIFKVVRQQGALIVAAMLDFLTFSLCSPYSETTDGRQFDMLLEKVAGRGRSLFRLFQHPSLTIVKVEQCNDDCDDVMMM